MFRIETDLKFWINDLSKNGRLQIPIEVHVIVRYSKRTIAGTIAAKTVANESTARH